MLYLLFEIIIVGIITFFGIKYFIEIAPKWGLIDIPNNRSSHHKPMPRGAGIAFGSIFIITYSIFNIGFVQENILTFLAITLVFAIGIIDDFFNVESKTKFLVLVLASVMVYYDGFVIDNLGTYFGYTIPLGFLALPFTVFALTGFTNALNLIDGKDGLAASVSIAILLVHVYIGYHFDDMLILSSALILITVLAVFLIFNWYPAKVFMGDSGSLFIGFIISILTVQSLEYINVTTVLILAGLPILDTMVVMMRRKQRKLSIFSADKNHIHHILYNMKMDVKFTVVFLTRIQVTFSLIAIQIISGEEIFNILIFINLFLIFFTIFDPRARARARQNKALSDRLRERYKKIHKKSDKQIITKS